MLRGDIDANVHEFNERINFLSYYGKKNGKKDYSSPCFAYSKFRPELRLVLSFLGKMSQEGSHFMIDRLQEPEYLLPGDSLEGFNRPVHECTYISFFVIMKWYYGYMHNKEKSDDSLTL